MSTLDVFDIFSRDYARERLETMSLRDWLLAARDDRMLYASPSERMVAATDQINANVPRMARAIPSARNQPQLRFSSSTPTECSPSFGPVDMSFSFRQNRSEW